MELLWKGIIGKSNEYGRKKMNKNYNRSKHKKCKCCKKEINNPSIWCISCWKKHSKAKKYYCKDCRKELHHKAIRCQKCMGKWMSKTRRGKNNSNYKTGFTTYQHYCVDCKKPISYTSIRCLSCQISLMNKNRWKDKEFKNKMRKIISKKAKKRLSIPENNSNWQGGKTVKIRPRHTTKYKIWREQVFKRDNFTCQKCKKRGGKLEAHHIKSWKQYPKLRFKISNGLTLCFKCHHKKGYKLNDNPTK